MLADSSRYGMDTRLERVFVGISDVFSRLFLQLFFLAGAIDWFQLQGPQ
jgi:hypothetical protein